MPDAQTLNAVMKSYGVSGGIGGGFNWWGILASVIFGIVGWYAFMHGWKQKSIRPSVIGILLMVYPWFISNVIWTWVVGIALTAALYFWKD